MPGYRVLLAWESEMPVAGLFPTGHYVAGLNVWDGPVRDIKLLLVPL